MVADCGTRPDKVNMEDVLEGGRWHNGAPWMKMTLEEAIHTEAIKPAMDLRINDEEKMTLKKESYLRQHLKFLQQVTIFKDIQSVFI